MAYSKKIIALTILTVTAAVSVLCLPAAAASVRKGDVDGNGIVETADAVMLERYDALLIELTEEQLQRADYNGDGVVDIIDAVYIMKNKAIELPPIQF